MGDLVQQPHSTRLRIWQIGTLILLVVGYSGYYLCRSNLSVVKPSLIKEWQSQGIENAEALKLLGRLDSLGVLAYAIGKFLSGGVGDFFGGRRNFLGGMAGAVLFTILFASGNGMPIFTIAWMGNRLVQSAGWSGMVKMSSRWFNNTAHSTVMAIVSLSYLWGDAAGRKFMAWLLREGLEWRTIFLVNAGLLAGWLVLCLARLREAPSDLGMTDGVASPVNLYGKAGEDAKPSGLFALLAPMIASPSFWCVCLLSLAMTFVRESMNNWSVTYFEQVLDLTKDQAADASAGFPFWGGCAVFLAGLFGDRLGRVGRALILFFGLLFAGLALGSLSRLGAEQADWAVRLVNASGFLLLAPYSFLTGVIALDFGGKRGSATVCGIFDGVGYLGGILAGHTIAGLIGERGWSTTFSVLASVTLTACIVGAAFWFLQARITALPIVADRGTP
jgi:sugar phosphate permease